VFYDKYLSDWKGKIKLMELAEFGSLADQRAVSANDMTVLIDQILGATARFHAHGYTHRDIKPDNILIFSRKPMLGKVCDFGTASNLCLKSIVGTDSFVAPEILMQKLPGLGRSHYTNAVDIFSIGATILSMSLLAGVPSVGVDLGKNPSIRKVSAWIEKSARLGVTESPSRPGWEHLTALAKRMVVKEPDSRPSATLCRESLTPPDSLAAETTMTAERLAEEKLANLKHLQSHQLHDVLKFSKWINADVHREPPIAINLVGLCSEYGMFRRCIDQAPSSEPHYDLKAQHGTGSERYISLRAAHSLLLEHSCLVPAGELLTLQHYIDTVYLAGCDPPDVSQALTLTGDSEVTTLRQSREFFG